MPGTFPALLESIDGGMTHEPHQLILVGFFLSLRKSNLESIYLESVYKKKKETKFPLPLFFIRTARVPTHDSIYGLYVVMCQQMYTGFTH